MIDKELSRQMKEEARSLGLCDEWYNRWGDASIQDMLTMFKRGFDFVLKHRKVWLKPGFLRQKAGKETLQDNYILANDKWSFANPRECFILGNSEANIRFNGSRNGVVWATGTAKVNLSAKGSSRAIVHLFDWSQLKVTMKEPDAHILAIVHGDNAMVFTMYLDDAEVKYERDYCD